MICPNCKSNNTMETLPENYQCRECKVCFRVAITSVPEPAERFKPGDRIQFKSTKHFVPSYVMVLLEGGWYIEGQWRFSSTLRDWNSSEFQLAMISPEESVKRYKNKYGDLDA